MPVAQQANETEPNSDDETETSSHDETEAATKPQDPQTNVAKGKIWVVFSAVVTIVIGLPAYLVLAPWPYVRALLNREVFRLVYLDAWRDSSANILFAGSPILALRHGKFEPACVTQTSKDDWLPDEKLQNNQIIKVVADVKFNSDGAVLERMPGKTLKDPRRFNTRSLLLTLLLVPSAVLIGFGFLLRESSIAAYFMFSGLWNGGMGLAFLAYVFFKRFSYNSKAMITEEPVDGLVEFWATFPALEQGAAAAIGLISFMGGVGSIARTLVNPPGVISLVLSLASFPYYVFGPLILVYVGGDHCRRVLKLTFYEVGQTVTIARRHPRGKFVESNEDDDDEFPWGAEWLPPIDDDELRKLKKTEFRRWDQSAARAVIEAPEKHPRKPPELCPHFFERAALVEASLTAARESESVDESAVQDLEERLNDYLSTLRIDDDPSNYKESDCN